MLGGEKFQKVAIVETLSVQLFCKYGIKPYLQPLNQSTNQPIPGKKTV
jgi:hypothetical protein